MREPIFIIGLHRSGSTLWHNILSMSPGLLRLTEMRVRSYWWQRDVATFVRHHRHLMRGNDGGVRQVVDLLFAKTSPPLKGLEGAFWRFENVDVVDDPAFRERIADRIAASDRTLGALVRALLDELTHICGKERACVKFPLDVGHMRDLVEWYPECKVVHITRDPRAMAMSRQNDPGGTAMHVAKHPRLGRVIRRASMCMVLQQYRSTARLHEQYRGLPNYRLFQYENLLADPEAAIREVCEFAGCEFVPEMLHPERSGHEHQPSSLTGKRSASFDVHAATRWQEVISPIDQWMISAVTRRSMERLEYFPDHHPLFA